MRQRSSCDVDSANNLPLLTHSDGKVYRVDSAFKNWASPKCCMLVADASWNFHFTTTDRDGTGRDGPETVTRKPGKDTDTYVQNTP